MVKFISLVLTLGLVVSPLSALAQTTVTNNFYVDSGFDFAGRSKVASSMRVESQNAYFFVEDLYYNSLTNSKRDELNKKLNALGGEFDTNIYPRLRSVYGSEWNPGIDGDSKITVLITRTEPGVAGYFLERNELSRSVDTASNEREMLYLSSDIILENTAKAHLAHEFVHLIEYNQRTRMRTPQQKWLSEALADYAPTLLGYNSVFEGSYLENRVDDFLSFSSDSLIKWNNKPVDFATSSLFMHYLAGHYGNNLLTNIMTSPSTGEEAVSSALPGVDFRDAFTDWSVANHINSTGKYAYRNPGLTFSNLHISTPLQYSIFSNSEITTNFFVEYGAAAGLKFVPGQFGNTGRNVLRVHFDSSGSSGNFNVPYVVNDIFGRSEVHFIDLQAEKGTAYIEDFGINVTSVIVIPSNYYNTTVNNPPSGSFTIRVNMAEKAGESGHVNGVTDYADGALLRAQGDTKVYVIKKTPSGELFKRWIPTAEIFEQYGHLRWQDIIDVDASVLDNYQESRLIKFIGDYRVYELNTGHTQKQWLNITPSQFEARGYNWNQIYEVNQKEYNYYSTGVPIN